MSKFNSLTFLLILTICLTNCKNKKIKINDLNPDLWKTDITGCDGYRKRIITEHLFDIQSLVGFDEKEVIETLGKPNQTLLYDRAQKFFKYSISCDTVLKPNKAMRLRFNALGYVNESLILQE